MATIHPCSVVVCCSREYHDLMCSLPETTCEIDGKHVTSDDIADATTRAFIKRKAEYPIVCGGSPKEKRKRDRKLRAAVSEDVKREFGIGAFGILLGLLGGPMGLLMAVVTCVFEFLVSKELDQRVQQAMEAKG